MTTPPAPSAVPGPRVLHLAERAAWEHALVTGSYTGSTRGLDLADVGFVHMSTAGQLPGVMALLYADVSPADVVLLVVDLGSLAAAGVEVRWERAPGTDEPFPHAYGAIPVTSVTAALELAGEDHGRPALPDLTGRQVMVRPPAG